MCFVLFRFRLFAFIEAAALRSIVLRFSICMRPDSHTQLPTKYLRTFFVSEMSLFSSIFVQLPFSLCMESTSYVFLLRMMFFYFVTGWIFETSAYVRIESNQSNQQSKCRAGQCRIMRLTD